MLAAIADVGGLWRAGDYYADAGTIVRTARDNGVRALRLDARDLDLLGELPELEFLHLLSDGRPPLDPIASLPRLRGLVIETGALRGTLDLTAHPDLRWLKLPLSGRGGAAVLRAILAGHPGVEDLRLNELPLGDLEPIASAYPSVRHLRIHGADRLRRLGDLTAWHDTLIGISFVFARLRVLDGIEVLQRLRYLDAPIGVRSLEPLQEIPALACVSLRGQPSLHGLEGHPGIRIARLTVPDDGDLEVAASWPALRGVIGVSIPGREVPALEALPPDHELVVEWREASQSTEPLLAL